MSLLNFDVLAHIEDLGDMHAAPAEYAGTRGKKKFMEGFAVTFTSPHEGISLRYRADIKDTGDTGWKKDGEFAGTRGKRRPVEGFSIELVGPKLAEYDVLYMAHVGQSGDTAWLANGDYCGLHRQGYWVEGFAVQIVPRKPEYVTLISKAASGTGKALVITAPSSPEKTDVLVSAPDGSDLQLWDRRPVRGGVGYALINKARPHLCIARGKGQEAVLKNVASIDTDDNCVWLDDTVPGPWNAIRSRTDLEVKLNMRGNPPYADRDNALIVYPWARGASNELWRSKKATYDLIGGTDEAALNEVARAIYQGCYPSIFKGKQRIGHAGITAVSFDITSAPVFRIQPSEILREALLALAAEVPDVSEESLSQHAVDAARVAGSTFILSVESIALSVESDNPLTTTASLEMAASVKVNLDRSLTLELRHGKLNIKEHPAIELILDKLFVPWLLNELNGHILDHIAMPAINLLGIELSTPALATQAPYVLAAASKVLDTVMLPAPTAWPKGKVFVGADEPVLDSVMAAVLAGLKPSGDWSYGIDIGICDVKLRAHYEIHFSNPQFAITPLSGNQYKVRLDLRGRATFAAKCGILSASPGAEANGYVIATAEVSVNAKNEVVVTFKSLDDIAPDWSFDDLPWWMDQVISKILGAFNPIIKLAITEALKGKQFEVYTIPSINAHIAGRTFEITLRDLKLDSIADAGKKPLAIVTGTTGVKIK